MSGATTITVRVPLAIRRRPGRKTIVSPEGGPADTQIRCRADPALLKAVSRAYRWKRQLEDGRYASISEIATAEKIDRGYVGSILRLTLLAPDIIEAILDGRQPPGLGLPLLLKPFPIEWSEQRCALGVLSVAVPCMDSASTLFRAVPWLPASSSEAKVIVGSDADRRMHS